MHHEKSISIIVPSLNEEAHLNASIQMICAVFSDWRDYEIIIVDDGSRDGTNHIAQKLCAENPKIKLVTHPTNFGRGSSIHHGFRLATMDFLICVNGKKDTTEEELRKIVAAFGQSDLTLSYQLNTKERPFFRYLLSILYLTFVNTLFGLRLRYYNGSSIIPRKLFNSLRLKNSGYAYETELLITLLQGKHTYTEVGVVDVFEKGRRSRAFRFNNIVSVFLVLSRLFFRLRIYPRKIG